MEDKLKEGYKLFIRKNDDDKLIGTMTLNSDEAILDVINYEQNDLEFIRQFPNVYSKINEENALLSSYNNDKKCFITSLNKKTIIGQYNDETSWNDFLLCSGDDFIDSLTNLDNKIVESIVYNNKRR